MSESVYRTLAQRLDAMPNGFPATESGAELRFLEKLFTPEEALLAGVMSMDPEPVEVIAARACGGGVDAKAARGTLKGMVRKGLITMHRAVGEGARGLSFALMPFVVGFYEAQLPRTLGFAGWMPRWQRSSRPISWTRAGSAFPGHQYTG